MNQSDARQSANYVTCPCQHCAGGIEFDASDFEKGETRTVECPHCHMETIIFVPEPKVPPMLANDNETWRPWNSFETARQTAEEGDPDAQFILGAAYWNGDGVPQDCAEAVKWYRLAAEQGSPSAQNNLGVAYKDGMGVQKDNAEALKWYHLAANNGSTIAQFNLGRAYYCGEGIAKDLAKAVNWWRIAAEQGELRAQYSLANAYFNGDGMPQNYIEAYKWASLATAQGMDYAKKLRDVLSSLMTPSQFEEGQRLASIEALKIQNPVSHTLQEQQARAAIPSEVRREVWRRDGGACVKCGSRRNLEYDHIVPVSKGGSNTARNIELLCETCNRAKSNSIQ
jgi:hypothetical protein